MKAIYLLFLALVGFSIRPAFAQPVGSLGTLTVGPYTSSATGTLTGQYVAGATLPTTIAYTNTSTVRQDSLCLTAQVLGNGYAQGLQGFFGKAQGVGPYTGQASFGLGDVQLPGPGSYLVQVSAYAYDRSTQKWVNGPTRVYWLFPLAQPLPVELVSFAACAAADSVSVVWETASERNCLQFEVQRSNNGSTWYKRATIPGHGSSSQRHRYCYTEGQALIRVYYRLRQVDYDGQEHYSPVVVLAPTPVALDVAKVFPNPARERAQVTAPAGVVVTFFDEAGRQRRQQTLDDTGSLDLHGLPAGSYHLLVGDGPHAIRTRLSVF